MHPYWPIILNLSGCIPGGPPPEPWEALDVGGGPYELGGPLIGGPFIGGTKFGGGLPADGAPGGPPTKLGGGNGGWPLGGNGGAPGRSMSEMEQ